jgi:hypothetical protein
MSTIAEIERAIEELPLEQRWQVLEHTRRLLETEIPESFRKAMGEIGRGEVMELEDALKALEQTE